jgi:hypothetical protein
VGKCLWKEAAASKLPLRQTVASLKSFRSCISGAIHAFNCRLAHCHPRDESSLPGRLGKACWNTIQKSNSTQTRAEAAHRVNLQSTIAFCLHFSLARKPELVSRDFSCTSGFFAVRQLENLQNTAFRLSTLRSLSLDSGWVEVITAPGSKSTSH